MSKEAKEVLKRHEDMKRVRQPYESLWQSCFDYMLPNKSDLLNATNPGAKKQKVNLYNSTGIQANELLAATLASALTNAQTQWFHLTTGDEALDRDDEIRKWLETTEKRMHSVLDNSNFHSEAHELYLDLGCIGTGTMSCEEDDEEIVRFASRHVKEITVGEDFRGIVNCVYREYELNVAQIVNAFGIEKVGRKIKKLYTEGKLNEKFCIVHAVEPRDIYDTEKKGPKNYPIKSCFILKDEAHELKEGGYNEFPYMVPRWSKISGEIYGRGPGQTALPDVKMLNKMDETTIQGAQLTIRPPMILPHNGYLLPLRLTPGGQNFKKGGIQDDIKPLITDARIDFGIQFIQMKEKKIMEAFFVDRFQLPNGPMMTATEVMQRQDVMYRYMGPMLANLQHQFLRPLIARVAGIMMRKGLIEAAPEKMRKAKLDVKYMSAVAKAQRTGEAQALQQALAVIAPVAQAQPSVAHNINGDEYARHVWMVYGLPESVLRDRKEVEDMRKKMAEEQQKAHEAEMQKNQAQAIGAAGPTLIKAAENGVVQPQ